MFDINEKIYRKRNAKRIVYGLKPPRTSAKTNITMNVFGSTKLFVLNISVVKLYKYFGRSVSCYSAND